MILTPEQTKIFLDSFADSIKASELKLLAGDVRINGLSHWTYKCPCGGHNHVATRAVNDGITTEPSFVLHCYETGRQWIIVDDLDIAGILHKEESTFRVLLDRFKGAPFIGKTITAKEAFRLRTERGVPVEMLEVDDLAEFDRLFDDHRELSRG